MQFLVCIAGLPEEAVKEIGNRPAARFTEDKSIAPIATPIKPPFAFRYGMSDFYLHTLAKRCEHAGALHEFSVLLAYVDYEGPATAAFVEAFFPFALIAPITPFYPDAAPKEERRRNLVGFVDGVERVVADLRTRARVVRDFFSGQNFSPLLLPRRNFDSNVLEPNMRTVFLTLGQSADPLGVLTAARDTVLRHHPLCRVRSATSESRFFEDDRGLRFKSPGRNRHAMARVVGQGHDASCLVASRLRFGGAHDPLFHFDCEYERRALDPTYLNCHGRPEPPYANTHVNIAPSDAVR